MNIRSFTIKTSKGIYTMTNLIIKDVVKKDSSFHENDNVVVLKERTMYQLVSIHGNKERVLHEFVTKEACQQVLDLIWKRLSGSCSKTRMVDMTHYI